MMGFAKAETLDALLTKSGAERLFSGCVLYAENGMVKYNKAYGYTDFRHQKKLGKDTVFRLASISKVFTSLAVIMLAHEGKLSLEDHVTDYLPSLPYDKVRLKHLMQHTSGIPGYVPFFFRNWSKEQKRTRMVTNRDVLDMLVKHRPGSRFKPGERFHYSNSGYVLLAMVVEKASGQPFGDFLAKRIFKPLGMKHSFLFDPRDESQSAKLAQGFALPPDGSPPVPNDRNFLSGIYGDGGVCSTTADLLKFDQALYSDKLLPRKYLDIAFTSAVLADGSTTGYGLGWKVDSGPAGQRIVSHLGGWLGFRGLLRRNLDDKSVLIILTNDTNQRFREITEAISQSAAGLGYLLPKPPVSRWLGRAVSSKGLAAAITLYKERKEALKKRYAFDCGQFINLGVFYIQKRQIKKALAVLKLNLAEHPADYKACNALGRACLYAKQFPRAIKLFKRSTTLNPSPANQAFAVLKRLREKAPPDKKHLFN